jgi:hypothetical protein
MPVQAGITNANLYATVLAINLDFLIGALIVMEATSVYAVHVTRRCRSLTMEQTTRNAFLTHSYFL